MIGATYRRCATVATVRRQRQSRRRDDKMRIYRSGKRIDHPFGSWYNSCIEHKQNHAKRMAACILPHLAAPRLNNANSAHTPSSQLPTLATVNAFAVKHVPTNGTMPSGGMSSLVNTARSDSKQRSLTATSFVRVSVRLHLRRTKQSLSVSPQMSANVGNAGRCSFLAMGRYIARTIAGKSDPEKKHENTVPERNQ